MKWKKGWLKQEIDHTSAEVATWPEGLRERPLSSFDHDTLKAAERVLEDRLSKIRAALEQGE